MRMADFELEGSDGTGVGFEPDDSYAYLVTHGFHVAWYLVLIEQGHSTICTGVHSEDVLGLDIRHGEISVMRELINQGE